MTEIIGMILKRTGSYSSIFASASLMYLAALLGPFQASVSCWAGAKVGLFAIAPPHAPRTGHADFDWFRVAPPAAGNALR